MSAQPPRLPGAPSQQGLPPGLADRGVELAGYGRRLAGRMIDTAVILAPYIFLEVVFLDAFSGWSAAISFIAPIAMWFLNDVVLTSATGGSVGKLIVGSRIVQLDDWGPIRSETAMRRWASSVVLGFIPFAGLLDAVWIFSGELQQTLHDKFADTVVVRSRPT